MDAFDSDAYVAAVAPVMGLGLTPSEVRDVAAQLSRIHDFARVVLDFELAPADEPALRFEP